MKHVYNLKRDKLDNRDVLFRCLAPSGINPEVDTRDPSCPIPEQGNLGSCTANSAAWGLFGWAAYKKYGVWTDWSRLFVYYNERKKEGHIDEDAGASVRSSIKTLCSEGVCREDTWPYDISQFTKCPSDICYSEASKNRLISYSRVTSLRELKVALTNGYRGLIGIDVYESFEDVDVTGVVPMPKEGEKYCGGHELYVVGHSDAHQWVITGNPWGPQYGDKGYFYIPYTVFNKIVSMPLCDMWVGKDVICS